MTPLCDLIARLEAAKEGSRELDAAIDIYVTGGSSADLAYVLEDVDRTLRPKHYTTSLDAALTLVPKGYFGEIDFGFLVDKQAAWVRKNNDTPRVIGYGKTPALALCIAALKAREAGR